MIKKQTNKCDICNKKECDELFCKQCEKRYKINKDKKCSNCKFFENNKCIIIKDLEELKKVKENYYCIYFINKNLNRSKHD